MMKTPPTEEVFMEREIDEHLNTHASSGVLEVMSKEAARAQAKAPTPACPISFEAFFGEHHARLYGTLRLVAGSPVEAEDVAQEAFVRVLERWDHVRSHENPAGYLYKAAFNLLRNRQRGALRAARRALAPREEPDAFLLADQRDELLDALRELTPRQRAAVVLTDLLDYPSREAGRMMGARPATVRVLASQGRAHLKARLETNDV